MEIHFIVKSEKNIYDRKGFKRSTKIIIENIIKDYYRRRGMVFKFEVEVKEKRAKK